MSTTSRLLSQTLYPLFSCLSSWLECKKNMQSGGQTSQPLISSGLWVLCWDPLVIPGALFIYTVESTGLSHNFSVFLLLFYFPGNKSKCSKGKSCVLLQQIYQPQQLLLWFLLSLQVQSKDSLCFVWGYHCTPFTISNQRDSVSIVVFSLLQ